MVGRLPWGLNIPLRPFFGVMAVAPPAGWGMVSTIQPRKNGGNMDNKELVAGTVLYLPIHIDGAMFSVGDGHGVQGDGEVTLDVQEESAEPGSALLHFSVADSGIGIALEKQATIFDAFTQADGSTARRYGGSGLGLTISRRLVELFGGRLWLESAPGRGSTFHFTARFAAVADSGEPPPLQPVNLEGVPVLVVDDNATNRLILEEMLTGWRMNSTLVGDAAEALEQINRAADAGRPFRLVLVDAAMPEADGFTLVEQLTKDSRLAAEKVMMMISVGQRGDAARSRDLGVAAYLTKPVAHAELLDAILRVLDISSRPAAPSSFAIHSLQESK